jgi:hypothetical protein
VVYEEIEIGDFMRNFYTFLLFALLAGCAANNQTITIKSIQSYDQVNFENITDPATVVLFDVDETLIQPEDTYLINEHSERGLKFRQSLIQKHPEISKMHDIGGIILDQAARPLIEKEVINKISTLKKNNINVFAITAMNTGEYSNIGRMERWRYEHLKKLGFEGTYQNDDFYLQGFKRKPVFYKSIIATDLEDKGEVLMAVLDKINLRPRKIIMFDDTLEFLYSVEKECKKRGIIFFGYHYNGAKKKNWDENLISYQAEYLIKHKKWLSDAEVKEKMRKKAL